jgi:sigma-E factor negative regulatory protein RseA
MTQELSSLMDGELDAKEAERAIRGCCGNELLKRKWQDYHVIGEAMRGEHPCSLVSTGRILAALEREPTVLAPRRRLAQHAGRIAFAAAASVATVAVVSWVGMQGRGAPEGPALAHTGPQGAGTTVVATTAVPLNVHDYVVVHRQVPSADFYRPVANKAVGAGR